MDDQEADLRRYQTPYNTNHPVPTIQRFRETKEARKAQALDTKHDDDGNHADDEERDGNEEDGGMKDTSELTNSGSAKEKRKTFQKRKDERIERIVTDPVTHLPVRIHDFTSEALDNLDKNAEAYGSTPETSTGVSNKEKSTEQLRTELEEIVRGQATLQAEFPPPEYQQVHRDLAKISSQSTLLSAAVVSVVLATAGLLSFGSNSTDKLGGYGKATITTVVLFIAAGTIAVSLYAITSWADRRIQSLWDAAVWHGKFKDIEKSSEKHESETTVWLNSLLSAVWPLINPDLFISVADMLEDVMQASLPSIVRMVSVDDIGQGSEAIRILGIRWLPTAAAGRAVSEDGKLQKANPQRSKSDHSEIEAPDNQMAQGMEAEEGDFINIEVAFAYRASSSGSTFKERMKDMHLYLAFYLPGNIKLPVWVDLRGVVGIMRLRLQLAPDPPFFGLCTMTLLGQPKVELSCVPLVKQGLNLMNLPILKSFVQSSIDAAMAEYVAPKSMTIDLHDMIAGDDFKKDVVARGVLVIEIIRGYEFKMGDMAIPFVKGGSADPYVTVGWAKFGKPLWSSRIIDSEMEPIWNETTYVLVTPDELNVDERLRLQLWDSDRFTADDDLGRIEVDIKHLMQDKATNSKMHTRNDGFRAMKADQELPGRLEWKVGYFPKASIQPDQLQKQTFDEQVKSYDDLKRKAHEISERKLRETQIKKGKTKKDKAELEQQKRMELQHREDEMLISAPPPDQYPSGIVSIQIHQITGLELSKLHKSDADNESKTIDAEEEQDDLPSAYCTIILNHAKIYKTRTKPKNAKPFFNAGTERFIGDWRNAEVHISVRDARVHEDDSLLGIVSLPLSEIFKDRSQMNGFFPLAGGVGYGRIRISMVWRSVKLEAPAELLGWQLGTLEVAGEVQAVDLPEAFKHMKLKAKTNISTGKLYPKDGQWHCKKSQSLRLAVQDRQSSCFTLRFRSKGLTGSKTEAFAIMWLNTIPDEEEQEKTLTVWKGDFARAIKSSISDCGEKVGSIKVKLTFWSGLGSAHTKWAVKHADMRDVIQVLETAHDNLEDLKRERQAGIVDEDEANDSDSSDSSDDDDDDDDEEEPSAADGDAQGGALSGIKDEVVDYKQNYKRIHRRNRGIMTWKAPRTAQWAFHSAEKVEQKLTGIFKRHSRGMNIETEA